MNPIKTILKSGRKIIQLETAVKLTIETEAPDKWLFVDLETGDVWVKRTENHPFGEGYRLDKFRSINKEERKELLRVAKMRL